MNRVLVAVSAVALSYAAIGRAEALTLQECSTKYQAAKQAGTLNGQKWNDFRKAECSAPVDTATTTVPNPVAPTPPKAAAPAPVPAPTAAKPAPSPRVAPTPATRAATPSPAPKPAPTAGGSPVFPSAVAPEYATGSAGKGWMQTCLEQYNANKAAGGAGNGGLNWIQKGGGYYAECNKRLKGSLASGSYETRPAHTTAGSW